MASMQAAGAPTVPHSPHAARWPGTIGLIGMAVGAIMAFNALQNLVHHVTWTEQQWRELLAPLGVEFVYDALPALPLMVGAAAVEIVLGVLLIAGSWWLFWREPRGPSVCRTWAWVTLAYVMITAVWIFSWLSRYGDRFAEVNDGARSAAYAGVLVTMVVLAAFPLFLLFWLAKNQVRAEYDRW